jgi:hypothetical protein
MIRIAITAEAFDAIAKTMPLGSVGYENEANAKGASARPGLRQTCSTSSRRCAAPARATAT